MPFPFRVVHLSRRRRQTTLSVRGHRGVPQAHPNHCYINYYHIWTCFITFHCGPGSQGTDLMVAKQARQRERERQAFAATGTLSPPSGTFPVVDRVDRVDRGVAPPLAPPPLAFRDSYRQAQSLLGERLGEGLGERGYDVTVVHDRLAPSTTGTASRGASRGGLQGSGTIGSPYLADVDLGYAAVRYPQPQPHCSALLTPPQPLQGGRKNRFNLSTPSSQPSSPATLAGASPKRGVLMHAQREDQRAGGTPFDRYQAGVAERTRRVGRTAARIC